MDMFSIFCPVHFSFFPDALQPIVAVMCNTIFSFLVKVKICRKPQRKYDVSSEHTITVSLPGTDPQDAERRRYYFNFATVTFRGAAARWGPPAELSTIGQFLRKIEQFRRLVTFENAAARWCVAHCKQKLPRRRRRDGAVSSPGIAMAAVPLRAKAWRRRHCSH